MKGALDIDPVDDDLGDWYSDYERRLDEEDEGDDDDWDEEFGEGWERNLAQTLDISERSFGEPEYREDNWEWE